MTKEATGRESFPGEAPSRPTLTPAFPIPGRVGPAQRSATGTGSTGQRASCTRLGASGHLAPSAGHDVPPSSAGWALGASSTRSTPGITSTPYTCPAAREPSPSTPRRPGGRALRCTSSAMPSSWELSASSSSTRAVRACISTPSSPSRSASAASCVMTSTGSSALPASASHGTPPSDPSTRQSVPWGTPRAPTQRTGERLPGLASRSRPGRLRGGRMATCSGGGGS